MAESQRWARCGSAPSVTIEALRRGLARAENPEGVLRGHLLVRRASHHGAAASSSATSSNASVSITGTQLALLGPSAPPRAPPPPVVLPHRREDRLPLRRAQAVIKFRGTGDDHPADWCCAICLRADWKQRGLSRLPHCAHVFHTACVDRWFERASACPTCRRPV